MEDAGSVTEAVAAESVLGELRDELDQVDGALMDAVRRRLEICARIGEVKQAHAIAMMQPARVGFVENRAMAFAEEHGLSPAFFGDLYRLLIDETCRLEQAIIDGIDQAAGEALGEQAHVGDHGGRQR